MSERTRAYIYRVGVASIALLVLYGVIGEAEAAEWALWLAAVLGLGEAALAAKHTSTKDGR